MTPILRTQRLLLRPLVAEDAGALTPLIGDYEVSKWLTHVPFPYTLADAKWFIASDMNLPGSNWAIEHAGTLIGSVGMSGELGYWLGRQHWRNGYMTEAVEAVVTAYFADPANTDAHSGYFVGNVGSQAILEGLGFIQTKIETVQPRSRPDMVQVQMMHLTRTTWEARHD